MLAVGAFGVAPFHVAEVGQAKISGTRRLGCEVTPFVVPTGVRGCVRWVLDEGIGLVREREFVFRQVKGRWLAGAVVVIRDDECPTGRRSSRAARSAWAG
jgi:hypothetical protein